VPSDTITLPDPADIRRANPATLVEYARTITREMNRYTALLGLVVTKTETDGIKATHQYNSAVQWLMHTTGMTEPAARQIVVRSRGTNSLYTIDGTEIPGVAPLTGLAALAGDPHTRACRRDRENDDGHACDGVGGGPGGGGENPGQPRR
jgi:hypothetical protein